MSNDALNLAWKVPVRLAQKLVLVRLADMANEKGECWPKQKNIAKDTGLSRSAVSKGIKELEALGYVVQIHQRGQNGRMRSSCYKLLLKSDSLPGLEARHGGSPHGETLHGDLPHGKKRHHRVQILDSNNHHIEPSLKENICVVEEGVQEAKADNNKRAQENLFQDVFDYWRNVMNHPRAKLDQKRKSKIQAAFRLGFTIEQLKEAIDGCKNTAFNMGENTQRQIYDGIDLIFRDAEKIERFMGNAKKVSGEQKTNRALVQMDQILEGAI